MLLFIAYSTFASVYDIYLTHFALSSQNLINLLFVLPTHMRGNYNFSDSLKKYIFKFS